MDVDTQKEIDEMLNEIEGEEFNSKEVIEELESILEDIREENKYKIPFGSKLPKGTKHILEKIEISNDELTKKSKKDIQDFLSNVSDSLSDCLKDLEASYERTYPEAFYKHIDVQRLESHKRRIKHDEMGQLNRIKKAYKEVAKLKKRWFEFPDKEGDLEKNLKDLRNHIEKRGNVSGGEFLNSVLEEIHGKKYKANDLKNLLQDLHKRKKFCYPELISINLDPIIDPLEPVKKLLLIFNRRNFVKIKHTTRHTTISKNLPSEFFSRLIKRISKEQKKQGNFIIIDFNSNV